MGKRPVGKPHRPIRKLKSEAIPALTSPALGYPPAFEHQMRTSALAQHVAHGQAGLAAADDEGFDIVRDHGVVSVSPCHAAFWDGQIGLIQQALVALSVYKNV